MLSLHRGARKLMALSTISGFRFARFAISPRRCPGHLTPEPQVLGSFVGGQIRPLSISPVSTCASPGGAIVAAAACAAWHTAVLHTIASRANGLMGPPWTEGRRRTNPDTPRGCRCARAGERGMCQRLCSCLAPLVGPGLKRPAWADKQALPDRRTCTAALRLTDAEDAWM